MLPKNCQSEQLCNKSHVGQMFYLFFNFAFAFENNFYRSPDNFWLKNKKKTSNGNEKLDWHCHN